MHRINKFIYLDKSDPYKFYIERYKITPYFRGSVSPEIYFKFYISDTVKKYIKKEILIDNISQFYDENTYCKTGFGCQLRTEEGLLRSIAEIKCYYFLKEHNIKFKIETPYKNSRMKDDFYLTEYDVHIEISGFYTEEYIKKMEKKKLLYNAIIIKDCEFEKILEHIKEKNEKNKN